MLSQPFGLTVEDGQKIPDTNLRYYSPKKSVGLSGFVKKPGHSQTNAYLVIKFTETTSELAVLGVARLGESVAEAS